MEKLTFKLEFITPAFIGGAKPRKAELRPASFVGLLRWWWRALRCEEDTEKLYEEDVKIFGGHLEEKATASKVMIRIKRVDENFNLVEDKSLKDYAKLNYFYDRNKRTLSGKDAGIGYLLYSTLLYSTGEKSFIAPGSQFELTFLGDGEIIKHYVASLWCLVFLGGIGTRARRGAGNMNCLSVEPEFKELSFRPDPKNLMSWIETNLKQAKKIVNGGLSNKKLKYSHLCPSVKIAISKEYYRDYKEALNQIGSFFKRYREEQYRKGNIDILFDMGYFGLPIRHSNGEFLKAGGYFRRSSPLIIRVLRVEDSYRWVLVKLNGEFLPENTKLKFASQQKSVDSEKANKVLECFFKSIEDQAFIKEVSL